MYEAGEINATFGSEVMAGRDFICAMFDGESRQPQAVYEALCERVTTLQRLGIPPQDFARCRRANYGRTIGLYGRAESIAGLMAAAHFSGMKDIYYPLETLRSATVEELEQRLREDYDTANSALRSSGRRAGNKENPNPMTTANRENRSRQIGAHMMALLVCIVWATTFVCSKELLAYYTPAQVMLMRFVLAYFVLWLLRPRPLPWQGRGELTFLLLGILGGTLYFWTENTALQHTFSANVSIIVAMAPILTSILAHFFTRDEKLHTTVWVGFAVAMSGVVLVVLNGALVLKLSPVGDLLAFLVAASWACYSVLIKRLSGRVDSTLLARRVILYGTVTSVPLLAARGELSIDFTPLAQPKPLFCILFLAVLGSAVCFAVWNVVIDRLGVVHANNYIYLQPFITIVASHFLLGEPMSWTAIVGALLIIGGVIISGRQKRPQ